MCWLGAALHMASANGHLDVVKCLIEHGAVSTSSLSEVMELKKRQCSERAVLSPFGRSRSE